MIKLFYSNRIERLYQDLKQQLFASSSPFAQRLVIVPTPAIKSWLLLQFAKDPDMGIAAGLEILYLNDALKKLAERITEKKEDRYIPNQLELTLSIETHIREIASIWNILSQDKKNIWQPLFNYLKITFTSSTEFLVFSPRGEKRLAVLSETLAKLFIEYGKYGMAMVAKWNAASEGWQQALWHHIFSTWNKGWSYPSHAYQSLEWTAHFPRNLQVHLFSISFMAASEYALFEKVSKLFPINYYSLSPCYHFWSDLLTDKEAKKLQKYWDQKGVPLQQQETLENYLRDKNSLLANWGKLGRKMAELLERDDYETSAHYALPSSIQNSEAYSQYIDDNLIREKTKKAPCLLDYLQSDILLLRNPEESEKIPIGNDNSLQVHSAPTKQREVQILYNNLLRSIEKEENIEPSDIIVMAPDIMIYAPYIQQIFGSEESQLDFQVMDMHAISEDSLIKQFWHLIDLPFGRWDAENIMYLFNFPSFQKKHRITPEEVSQIRHWIEETGILWGENCAHRNEILRQHHAESMVEDSDNGTWEDGFSHLLRGLIMQDPFSSLEVSQGILLGKWVSLIRLLRQDLKKLSDGSQKTYAEWILELKRLITVYLLENENDEDEDDLSGRLDEFEWAARWMPDQKVSFVALKKHLETFLNGQTFVFRENHLQAVRFCSLLPMRAIPAKVIALVGMNDYAFPRPDSQLSLNLMKEEPACDYCPSHTDYDRYLFLEALLSARKTFILSYTNYSMSDGKEQNPSLLITELLNYLDQNFMIEGATKLSEALTYKHPYQPFHYQYFSNDEHYKNYSFSDYRAALSYYQKDKKPPHCFIHDFEPQASLAHSKVCLDYVPESTSSEIIIDIKQIKTALHNPLKSYLNKTLGIYLKDEETALPSEEPFVVDSLQLHDFKRASLKQNLNTALQEEIIRGKIPLGLFKKTALYSIQNTINNYHQTLVDMGVNIKKIFGITLNEQYEKPLQDNEGWKLPPLTIKYNDRKIQIVGTLAEVSEQGLIANIQGNKSDATKFWGEFVILNCLIDCYQLPIQKQLLCTKSGKIKEAFFDSPFSILEQILAYYFQSLDHVSPLTGEWLHDLVHNESEILQKTMYKSLNDNFYPMHNEYLKWICRADTFDAGNMVEHWQPRARELFSNLYQAWTSKDA